MSDIQQVARQAAREAQDSYWKRDDDLDACDVMADAVAVKVLRKVEGFGSIAAGSAARTLLAAFTPAEPPQQECAMCHGRKLVRSSHVGMAMSSPAHDWEACPACVAPAEPQTPEPEYCWCGFHQPASHCPHPEKCNAPLLKPAAPVSSSARPQPSPSLGVVIREYEKDALADARPARTPGDVAWLIERYHGSSLVYWTGRQGEHFSADANWAVRFSRYQDAEQVRCHVVPQGDACRSVEHLWMAPAEPQTPEPETQDEQRQPVAADLDGARHSRAPRAVGAVSGLAGRLAVAAAPVSSSPEPLCRNCGHAKADHIPECGCGCAGHILVSSSARPDSETREAEAFKAGWDACEDSPGGGDYEEAVVSALAAYRQSQGAPK